MTLYSVVHSLVNPIVTQQHDLATIANYLIQHFVPALNSTHIDIDSSPTSSDELNASHFILKEQFQDVLIDVVWQFGEEIDSGLINVHQSQPVDDNQHDDKLSLIQHDNPDQQAQPSPNHEMDVDQKDNEPLVQIPAKSAEELEQEQAVANQARVEAEQAQRLKEKQSARERLGQFVKLLVVRAERLMRIRLCSLSLADPSLDPISLTVDCWSPLCRCLPRSVGSYVSQLAIASTHFSGRSISSTRDSSTDRALVSCLVCGRCLHPVALTVRWT